MAEDRRFSPEYGRYLKAELKRRVEELEEQDTVMETAIGGSFADFEKAMEGWRRAKVRLAKVEMELEYYKKHRIIRVNHNRETLDWARKGV